jgi:uncharacterized membrane-anchored protein
MRQSGTVVLALVFAWLLVVAEARVEHSSRGAERDRGAQVVAWQTLRAAAKSGAATVSLDRTALAPRTAVPVAGLALRRCLRGIVLLI